MRRIQWPKMPFSLWSVKTLLFGFVIISLINYSNLFYGLFIPISEDFVGPWLDLFKFLFFFSQLSSFFCDFLLFMWFYSLVVVTFHGINSSNFSWPCVGLCFFSFLFSIFDIDINDFSSSVFSLWIHLLFEFSTLVTSWFPFLILLIFLLLIVLLSLMKFTYLHLPFFSDSSSFLFSILFEFVLVGFRLRRCLFWLFCWKSTLHALLIFPMSYLFY